MKQSHLRRWVLEFKTKKRKKEKKIIHHLFRGKKCLKTPLNLGIGYMGINVLILLLWFGYLDHRCVCKEGF
jgi:hypothetical protein